MLGDVESALKVTVANALAKAYIIGVQCCEEEDIPLTQNQQIEMLRNSIMAYDEAIEAIELFKTVEQFIGGVRVGPSIRGRFGEGRPAG